MADTETRREPGMRVYVAVWIGLLVIVAAEVAATYAHLTVGVQLAVLLALAVLEAGIALLYFMHLKYERPSLFWSLIPALVVVLVLMDHFWPDAVPYPDEILAQCAKVHFSPTSRKIFHKYFYVGRVRGRGALTKLVSRK